MSIIQPRRSSVANLAAEWVADWAPRAATAQCPMCGAALDDVSQKFCGGDTCDRIWMRHSTLELYKGEAAVCRR
jgi:hypothetical protein